MAEPIPTYDFLGELFASYRLMPRGRFYPSPYDGVPGDPPTLILVGDTGSDYVERF
mgnify:CR=1 FL=1